MIFAEKIRAIRERWIREKWREEPRTQIGSNPWCGLTGEELAEILGVRSKSTIHNYETGKTESRDPEVLRKVDELWEEMRLVRLEWERVYGRVRRN